MQRDVVHRIEDGMDRQQVLCTTYQQRSFYTQMRDGFFTRNEVFNYALHHWAALWAGKAPAGSHLLDVCCGRGLMLPLLRFHAKELGSYTGIDIKRSNATWLKRRVTTGEPYPDGRDAYYPWPTFFVEGNVAHAERHLVEQVDEYQPMRYDRIIYTAAIEHMHRDDGQASLHECRKLAADGALMLLTCPNTPEDQDGYDTRYRAHVYEWKLSELRAGLADAGWDVERVWGVDAGMRTITEAWRAQGLPTGLLESLRQGVPSDWLAAALAPMAGEQASEVAILARAGAGSRPLF